MAMPSSKLLAGRALLLASAVALVACAATPPDEDPSSVERWLSASSWVRASKLQPLGGTPGWRHQRFGQHRPTRYSATEQAGRPALQAASVAGNSTMRLPLASPVDPALRLRFACASRGGCRT